MLQRYSCLYACILLLTGLGEAIYMPDYEFIPDETGWLRLHIRPVTWSEARVRCNAEGDILASPTTNATITLMMAIMDKQGMTESRVFVDIHTTLSERVFMAIDGTSLANISLRWAEGEPSNANDNEDCLVMTAAGELADESCTNVHPYFCLKKMGVNSARTVLCETDDEKYKFEPRTGSCYKFHNWALAWFPASMACAAEHAHLAVINSNEEAEILKEIYKQYTPDMIKGAHYTQFAHIGFWDWNEKSDWMTIFGETLTEAGYNKWAPNEPNNPGEEICGSVTREAKLNDGYCITMLPFICESMLTTKPK